MSILVWIGGAGVAAILWWKFIYLNGNPKFWKLVASDAEAAERFFRETPGWHIGNKPSDRSVVGPFMFRSPSSGYQRVKLYCDADKIDKLQEAFVQHLRR
jgi:hypothetical protein